MGNLPSYSHTFTQGTKAKASEVNTNFSEIKTAHNATDAELPTYTNGSRAIVSKSSQDGLEEAAATTTEINYLSGVTSAIQTQLNALNTMIIGVACSNETTNLTTGVSRVTFRMPQAMTLTEVRANVNTAPTGSTLQVDINETGSSVLSTKLTIDAGEKTSETATTPPVISDSSLADDAEITIDIDQVGSTVPGKGLKVWLIGILV